MNCCRYWASVAEYGYGFYAMNCCINWTMVADPDYMSWTACRYWNIFAKSGSGFYVMNCWIYNEPWLRIRIRILSQELLYNWTMVADPDFMSWTASCIYIYNEPLMRIRIGPRWLQTLTTLTSNFFKLNLAFCQIKSKFYTKELNEWFFFSEIRILAYVFQNFKIDI